MRILGNGAGWAADIFDAATQAAAIEWDTALVWPDRRRDHGEARQCGIGYMDQQLYVVVFTDQPDGRRIISLRKASRREVNRYAQA